MRKGSSRAAKAGNIDPDVKAQLRAAAALPDEQINTADPDAPEVSDWAGAVRGRFYRPVKRLKSLRIDADVLAYFESQGAGYQTRMNRVLRASMLAELRRQRQAAGKTRR